jgi:hypothetical protein
MNCLPRWTVSTPLPHKDQDRVRRCLDETAKQAANNAQPEANRPVTMLSIPAHLKRTGKEMRIIVSDGSEPAAPVQ